MLLTVHEVEGGAATLFRIVKTDDRGAPEFLDCLRSNYELGCKPRKIEHRFAVLHMGLSMYDTQEAAIWTAQTWPKIGRYVAELRLIPGEGFGYTDQTGQPGHLTVWGRPDQLRRAVADIVAIQEL